MALPHRRAAGLGQALRLDRRLADVVHAAGVAVVAVLDDGHVDIEQVAALEHPLVGNAVADHVVDRGADGLREAAVAHIGRDRLLDLDDVVVADPVQLIGGDPGDHVLADHVQHVGGQAARKRAIWPVLPGS